MVWASVTKENHLKSMDVIENFLGYYRPPNYIQLVDNHLTAYKSTKWNMSLKMHFWHLHCNEIHQTLSTMKINSKTPLALLNTCSLLKNYAIQYIIVIKNQFHISQDFFVIQAFWIYIYVQFEGVYHNHPKFLKKQNFWSNLYLYCSGGIVSYKL